MMSYEKAKAMVYQIDEMIQRISAANRAQGIPPQLAGELAAVQCIAGMFMAEPELLYAVYTTYNAHVAPQSEDQTQEGLRRLRERLQQFSDLADLAVGDVVGQQP